jgi:uncharacterized protein
MSRFFHALHEFAWHRPRAAVAVLIVLSLLSAVAILRLRFSSDISNVLPAQSPAVDAVEEVMEHFPFTGQMFVFFERTGPKATDEAAMKLADAIGTRLQGQPEIRGVDWKLGEDSERFFVDLVSHHGPLLLGDGEMDGFLKRLESAEIRATLKRNRKRLHRPGFGIADVLVKQDPLNLTEDFFLKRLAAGRPGGRVDISTGYYFNEGRMALLMTVEGAEPPQNVAFSRLLVARVNGALAEARREVPGADGWTVSLLGGYPVALQAESAIKSDLKINILTSIPPVLIMLLISLRRWSSLAIGAVSLTAGILWTFGLAGLVYGHLTAVTVGFAGLLAGMGIDFTIHMFHRYRHERALGLSPRDASLKTYAGTGPGAFIAMITTAFSILCLWVSSFRGLREFGTLVGSGVLLVFASTFLVIPLFTRLERTESAPRELSPWTIRACWVLFAVYFALSVQLLSGLGVLIVASCILLMTQAGTRAALALIVGRPRTTAVLSGLITVLSLLAMSRPPLGLPARETDVKNLRTEGDQILEIEARMRKAFGTGDDPILILVQGPGEDEVLERVAAVTEAVGRIPESEAGSITQFLPPAAAQSRQAAKLATVDADRVLRDLDGALDAEGFDPAAFDDARTWLRGLLAARSPLRPSEVRNPFFVSLRARFMAFDAAGRVRSLVWFTPKSPLQDLEERDRLITTLRTTSHAAAPGAVLSGFSVILREIDDRIGPDIFWSALAGGGVSILLAWLLYGSFRWMVVSILPAFIGTFWFLGCLKLMDMKMNYLNLIVFPILAGMATDNGLYLVERFREIRQKSCLETVSSLWPSLTLTSLTTIVGFGSLAFSANRAMKSLGVAISVGMLCYLFASLLVLPPILRWMEAPDDPAPPAPGP